MRTTQCAVRSMRPLLASICGFVAGENKSIHVHCACACATFRFSRACVRGVSLKPSATRKTIFLVLYQFVSVDALRKRDPHQQKETSLMSLPWNLELQSRAHAHDSRQQRNYISGASSGNIEEIVSKMDEYSKPTNLP